MKITFIEPPNLKGAESFERVFGCNYTYYPIPNIFVLVVAAVLKNAGYEVNYIDAANMYWKEKEINNFLEKDNSDIISVHSTNLSKENDLIFVDKIRKNKKNIIIVFTGPAPTINPSDFIINENMIVIRGEPEYAFLELVKWLKGQSNFFFEKIRTVPIYALSYMLNGKVINNPSMEPILDLDSLPFPDRNLLNKNLYYCPKIGKEPWTVVLTSRGCSYRCIYCVPCTLSFSREIEYKSKYAKKPPVRKRTAKNVIEELKLLKEQGYRSFTIIDDNFPWEEDRTFKICKGIEEFGFQWGCLARADHITERVADAFAKSGCQFVDIGVESFDQKILDYINKNLKVERIYQAIDILKRYKIDVKLNILLGTSPLETKETILNNLKIIKKIKPSTVMFSIVSPFPGTDYYKICKENKWFANGDYHPTSLQKDAIVNYPNLTTSDLKDLIKKINYSYYFSFSFIFLALKRIKSLRGFIRGLISLKRKLSF